MFRYYKQRCALRRRQTQEKSIVAITVRCEVTAMWKTNLCNLLKSFIKNWWKVIHSSRINRNKMLLFGTHTEPWAAAGSVCALFIFDPLPPRRAIKLHQKCNWHWCLIMGHLEKYKTHSGVQTSKSRIHNSIMTPIISLIAQEVKAWNCRWVQCWTSGFRWDRGI